MKKLVVLAAALLFTAPALAKYPDKPVTLVCGTSPGSGAARWCQTMAQGLAKPDALGVPVRVIYKPAGSGNESAVYTDQRPADGYTLMHANASYAGYMNLPTFSVKRSDIELVARVEKSLYVLMTPTDSPYKTFADVVAAAKAEPGKLSVGGNKLGSNAHLQVISLFDAAGVKVNHVPYRGTGESLKDLLGHNILLALSNPVLALPHIKAGALRALVLLDSKRLPQMPDVPTPHDLDLNYDLPVQWQGFFLKAGTPAERKAIILKALATVVHSPDYQAYLKRTPGVISDLITDGPTLQTEFAKELKRTRAFMKANGLL
jgi:tripartite-type tricarboxylate transporter receptor subunit TctC